MDIYKPSRDKMGNWLPIFEDVAAEAEALLGKYSEKMPNTHPVDIARAIKDAAEYAAICRLRKRQREEREEVQP